jgi:hypothetical protein
MASLTITRQAIFILRNNVKLSRKHCCSGKAIIITYSERVFVDLGIQYAMRMHRIIYCHQWPVWFYHIFPHHTNDRTCGKKVIKYKMPVLIFSTISVRKFLILRRIQLGTIINVHRSLCQVLVIPLTL